MAYADIPTHCRGTLTIEGKPWHYRLDKYGQLMIVAGEDPRDWTAIDAGALDYTRIAAQEHMQDGFTGHDGPKIAAACHLCAAGNEDVITAKTRRLIEAKKNGQKVGQTADDIGGKEPVAANSPAPAVLDPVAAAEKAARDAQAEIDRLRAEIDQRDKAALAAKPAPQADADDDTADDTGDADQ